MSDDIALLASQSSKVKSSPQPTDPVGSVPADPGDPMRTPPLNHSAAATLA